jgi:hypothetical protein
MEKITLKPALIKSIVKPNQISLMMLKNDTLILLIENVSLPMFAKQFKSILTISTILTKIEFRV